MANKIRPELLDELLAGAKTQEAMFGPNGLLKQLTGALVERALRAELGEHLDDEQAKGERNRRPEDAADRAGTGADRGAA